MTVRPARGRSPNREVAYTMTAGTGVGTATARPIATTLQSAGALAAAAGLVRPR
jgi:hypothetical protein